jgi:hypothetical protein
MADIRSVTVRLSLRDRHSYRPHPPLAPGRYDYTLLFAYLKK